MKKLYKIIGYPFHIHVTVIKFLTKKIKNVWILFLTALLFSIVLFIIPPYILSMIFNTDMLFLWCFSISMSFLSYEKGYCETKN